MAGVPGGRAGGVTVVAAGASDFFFFCAKVSSEYISKLRTPITKVNLGRNLAKIFFIFVWLNKKLINFHFLIRVIK